MWTQKYLAYMYDVIYITKCYIWGGGQKLRLSDQET